MKNNISEKILNYHNGDDILVGAETRKEVFLEEGICLRRSLINKLGKKTRCIRLIEKGGREK